MQCTPIEEAATDDSSINHNGHSISYNDLSEIIRFPVQELLRLVMLEMPRSDYQETYPRLGWSLPAAALTSPGWLSSVKGSPICP